MGRLQHAIALAAGVLATLLLSSASGGTTGMKDAKAWIDKGMLQREAGNPESSRSFEQAVNILNGIIEAGGHERPDLAGAYTMRARCYSLLGNNERALRDLDRAIAVSHDNGEIYYLRSYIHEIMGHEKPALDDLRAAAGKGFQKARDELTSKGLRWQ